MKITSKINAPVPTPGTYINKYGKEVQNRVIVKAGTFDYQEIDHTFPPAAFQLAQYQKHGTMKFDEIVDPTSFKASLHDRIEAREKPKPVEEVTDERPGNGRPEEHVKPVGKPRRERAMDLGSGSLSDSKED